MAEIDYGKGIRGFLGRMPDIDFQYTPIPFQEMLALGKMSMQKDMLNQRNAAAKEQEILNMYKTISDIGKTNVPGLEDEMSDMLNPYLQRIEQGIESTGGDISKFSDGFPIMMDLYKDLNTERFGSLQRAGNQYAAALADVEKLNESYLSGDGGVPKHISQYALQIGADRAQKEWDKGNPAVFSMANLSEHIDVIPKLRTHLKEMEAIGYIDPDTGNKVKTLTPEVLTNAATRYMGTDDKIRRSIMQEINLPLQAGAIAIPQAGSEEASELLSNPRYAQVYNDTMVSMMGAPNAEQAGIAAAHRASLIDKRVNEYATSASEVFVQFDQGDDNANILFDPSVAAQGTSILLNIEPGDVEYKEFSDITPQIESLESDLNKLTPTNPDYTVVEEQLQNLKNVKKAKKTALKERTENLITTVFDDRSTEEGEKVYEGIISQLSSGRLGIGVDSNEKKIVNLLAGVDDSLYIPLSPKSGVTRDDVQSVQKLKDVLEPYAQEFDLDLEPITKNNAENIINVANQLREKINKIENASSYEQKVQTLTEGLVIGDVDDVGEFSKNATEAFINGSKKFVIPATDADLNAFLTDNNVDRTNGYKTTEGVRITPTATFQDGRQLYSVSYLVPGSYQGSKKVEAQRRTMYVAEAEYAPGQNNVNYLAENLKKSNNPANQMLGRSMQAANLFGSRLQVEGIETAQVDQVGDLSTIVGRDGNPLYATELPYTDRPVSGISSADGRLNISTIRKVKEGENNYVYYLLNPQGEYWRTPDNDVLRSKSVLDLGEAIYSIFNPIQ